MRTLVAVSVVGKVVVALCALRVENERMPSSFLIDYTLPVDAQTTKKTFFQRSIWCDWLSVGLGRKVLSVSHVNKATLTMSVLSSDVPTISSTPTVRGVDRCWTSTRRWLVACAVRSCLTTTEGSLTGKRTTLKLSLRICLSGLVCAATSLEGFQSLPYTATAASQSSVMTVLRAGLCKYAVVRWPAATEAIEKSRQNSTYVTNCTLVTCSYGHFEEFYRCVIGGFKLAKENTSSKLLLSSIGARGLCRIITVR